MRISYNHDMEKIYEPKVKILADSDEVDKYVSDLLIHEVQSNPESVLTLPTGGTPVGIYARLVAAYKKGDVSFKDITTLNLDEYWPIKKTHPSSYAYYMNHNFFDHVDVPEDHRNIPNGDTEDAGIEAERYEQLLKSYTIDIGLITLGPGETCHIGFNERGSALDSRVRYVNLDQQTKEANMRFFDNVDDMPTGAITQGVADILEANHILFVATGQHKAWGVRRSLKGEVSNDAPASFLRYHPNVTVVLDKAAAELLH
jgi:glucosamine-6-phosphate deaminase